MLGVNERILRSHLGNKDILYKRLRIPVEIIYRNPEMAYNLSRQISRVNGVSNVSANSITGKVLIIFDEKIISETKIFSCIYEFVTVSRRELKQGSEKTVIEITNQQREISDSAKVETSENIMNSRVQWHSTDSEKIKDILKTDFKRGLSKIQVESRINDIGLNVLTEKKRTSLFSKFLEHLKEFPSNLLLGVGSLSVLMGQIPEAIALFGVVFVETIIGSFQQHKAEKSMHSLKDVLVPSAKVVRDDTILNIDTKYLVPGDIILLEAGDKVPADARILECNRFSVTEASLTGESTTILKTSGICSRYAELGNRSNMVYMGSNVISGNAKAVVTETGQRSQVGKISEMLQSINAEATPLQIKIKKLTDKICKMSLIGFLVGGGIALIAGFSLPQVITTGVSIVVGALPEGLPAVVAVSLALSAKRITKQNAVIRKLTAVETLGSTSVICCDKTGTLTLNEMTVKEIYASGMYYSVSGSGYSPEGKISAEGNVYTSTKGHEHILTAGVLCNNSALINKNNKWIINGDPTEGALLTVAVKAGIDVEKLKKEHERVIEIPFDCSKRYMTIVVKNSSFYTAYSKGAPDCVIEKCKFILENGQERLMTDEDKERLLRICHNMGKRALRVLALAYSSIESVDADIEKNYVFLGLVGMEDPPRTDVKETVQKCHKAGIKVVMITGDHKETAASIGRETGILTDGLIVTGAELDTMTDEKLDNIVNKIQIFARTSPEQKYRIVKAYKRKGHVVAMTGDGVNDAPAIKEANIGIAMGANGSDLAKDVSSITLIDDNFNTIVKAIEEGRLANRNIKDTMKYLLIGNLAEILTVSFASFFVGALPLISIQILWFNIFSESVLSSALAAQKSYDTVMEEPPVKADASILDKKTVFQIVKRGAGMAISTTAIFSLSMLFGTGINKARTLAFANLICLQIVNMIRCGSSRKKMSSKAMNIAAAVSFALLLSAVYLPFLSYFLTTAPLGIIDWISLGAFNIVTPILF
jgi:P-type Ca2+ transporter type 2C